MLLTLSEKLSAAQQPEPRFDQDRLKYITLYFLNGKLNNLQMAKPLQITYVARGGGCHHSP